MKFVHSRLHHASIHVCTWDCTITDTIAAVEGNHLYDFGFITAETQRDGR